MNRSLLSLAVLTAVSSAAVAFGQTQPSTDATTMPASAPAVVATTPAKTAPRWDEDYSYLKNPNARTDLWDPLKYIPLPPGGDWYLSLGGQVRERFEYFNFNTFGAGPQTKPGYSLTRITEHLDLHLSPMFRIFVQADSALEDGRNGGPRPPDRDEFDLEQAFGDVKLPITPDTSFTFRGGRQYLSVGAERLVGPSDWLNVRRTFDGFSGILSMPNNTLDMFLTRPVLTSLYDFDASDDNNVLAGLYDTLQLPAVLPGSKTKAEVYLLYLDRRHVKFPMRGGTGTEDIYTLGGRISGNPKPFDYDLEADYQTGDFKDQNVEAWAIATKEGYTISCVPLKPRGFIGFDIASGGSAKGTIETFNQLYPTGHGQFGNIDAIGRSNIIDVDPGLDLTLLDQQPCCDQLWVRTSFYEFWRQNLNDAVVNAFGTVLRPGGTSTKRYIGNELDVQLNWKADAHLFCYAGYAHFFPGGFIRATGPSKSIDFAYASLAYTF